MSSPRFVLPPLPKPEYQALQALRSEFGGGLSLGQLEVVCCGVRALCRLSPEQRAALLAEFRAQAPSETPPLLPPNPAS